MSTSQQQQEEGTLRVVECGRPDCTRSGRPWDFQKGYCSVEHWHQDVGRKALSGLKYSHTRCFTCLSILKEIQPPKPKFEFRESGAELTYNADRDIIETVRYGQEKTRQAACGYQHLTPEATIGEKNVGPKIVTGTICDECGSTDHTEHIATVAGGHRTAALAVEYLDDEDEDDFDGEVLHRRYAETDDIELATGAAIIECRD